MNITIDKSQEELSILCADIGKYKFRFGIYRWPWIGIEPWYESTMGAIVDGGVLSWLFYGRIRSSGVYKYGYFRVFCIGVGIGRDIGEDITI